MYKYNLTTISELIHFNLEHKDWIYTHGAQKSLEAMQVEGVYGLIQRLKKHDVALLADEVGMGKTIQALGVMSLKI
jgi:SNF2 family DNA or RNA helicase